MGRSPAVLDRSFPPAVVNDRQAALAQGYPLDRAVTRWGWVDRHPIPQRHRGWGLHTHATHQLCWAAEGALMVETSQSRWVIPPSQAFWVPAGVVHDVTADTATTLHFVYLHPERTPLHLPDPTVITADDMMRATIDYLGSDLLRDPKLRSAGAVDNAWRLLFDLCRPMNTTPLQLPMPSDPRARRIAITLLEYPDDPRTLEEWAAELHTSSKTLSRLFRNQTSMTFHSWHTQARLHASLSLLAQGLKVAVVARRVGYSPNAYVEAFRKHFGHVPSQHF